MLKYADYVKKNPAIFVPVRCNHILSNYLVGLNYRKFCLEPYVEVATRRRYYTNIIIKKKKKKEKKICLKFKRIDQVTL
jgi:hypothetical protein